MSTPSTGSVSSVDPGKIKQFAQFLDDIALEFGKQVVDKLAADPDDKEPFGNYDESARAAQRHAQLVTESRTSVTDVHERMTNLASATHTLSARYADVDELNEASSDDVTDAIAQAKEG